MKKNENRCSYGNLNIGKKNSNISNFTAKKEGETEKSHCIYRKKYTKT